MDWNAREGNDLSPRAREEGPDLCSVTRRTALGGMAAGLVGLWASPSASALATPSIEPTPSTAPSPADTAPPGDRQLGERFRLPRGAFRQPGSGYPSAKVIDVTQVEEQIAAPAGTNARPGDSDHDSATAFIAALDFVLATEFDPNDQAHSMDARNRSTTSWMIYVPDGEYTIGQTIQYSPLTADPFPENIGGGVDDGPWFPYWVNMRIIGESREGTMLRLRDGIEGWADGQSVIDFNGLDGFNNWSAQTVLRNLTVDIGNNPGATGVDFYGANNSRIDNVRIVDPHRLGRLGLALGTIDPDDHATQGQRGGIASGYYSNIVIDGFDTGIAAMPYHMSTPALEHVTLVDQRSQGFLIHDALVTMRSVLSRQRTAPAVRVTGTGAHVVVLDSILRATGTPTSAAIESGTVASHLFARNVDATTYPLSVAHNGRVVTTSRVGEWVSDNMLHGPGDTATTSLDLDVAQIPRRPGTDLDGWVNVHDLGAAGDGLTDDTAAIQAAMDAPGAKVVYFPAQQYLILGTIRVPATIVRLELLFTNIHAGDTPGPDPQFPSRRPLFEVLDHSAQPLWIENLSGQDGFGTLVRHRAPRTLVVDTIRTLGGGSDAFYENNTEGPNGDLFWTNVTGAGSSELSTFRNQRVHARWINSEDKSQPNFRVGPGATVLVHGFKVEGGTTSFHVHPGGVLEVLGGLHNQTAAGAADEDVAIINDHGTISIVSASSGPPKINGAALDVVIRDLDVAGSQDFVPADFPPRIGREANFVCPLFRG